jgi:hypothetical protein
MLFEVDGFVRISVRTNNDKSKHEMQGSLHYAAHDKAVHRSGRDDDFSGEVERAER